MRDSRGRFLPASVREVLERDPAPTTRRLERKVWDRTFWENPRVVFDSQWWIFDKPTFHDELLAWYRSQP